MHLQAGDSVTIVREANHSLSIFPNTVRAPIASGEVHSLVAKEDRENTLKRKVVSMYLTGYNVINLKSKSGRIYQLGRWFEETWWAPKSLQSHLT